MICHDEYVSGRMLVGRRVCLKLAMFVCACAFGRARLVFVCWLLCLPGVYVILLLLRLVVRVGHLYFRSYRIISLLSLLRRRLSLVVCFRVSRPGVNPWVRPARRNVFVSLLLSSLSSGDLGVWR